MKSGCDSQVVGAIWISPDLRDIDPHKQTLGINFLPHLSEKGKAPTKRCFKRRLVVCSGCLVVSLGFDLATQWTTTGFLE